LLAARSTLSGRLFLIRYDAAGNSLQTGTENDTEITLDEAKLHCRIDDDYEDALIQAYIDAALEVCQKHIGKRFDNGLEFTPAIKIGCLMYVSQLYEYRTMIGDTDAKEIPMAVSALWSVYRDVGVY
jgi:uncharacterized phage protein (predicted DNA packaging)